MSVSSDLQDIISDITVAIVERRQLGRVDLERLRVRLDTVRQDASAGLISRLVLDQAFNDIEDGVVNARGRIRHARTLVAEAAR